LAGTPGIPFLSPRHRKKSLKRQKTLYRILINQPRQLYLH